MRAPSHVSHVVRMRWGCIPAAPLILVDHGSVATEEPRTRRPFAALDAVARHPGTPLVVTVVLWMLDHVLS